MQPLNFFTLDDAFVAEETFATLHQDDRVKIEHIASHGQASPEGFWYDQPDDEWVMLVQGQAVLVYDDGRRAELSAGDQVFIPKHQRHRVASTSKDARWLAVHIVDH